MVNCYDLGMIGSWIITVHKTIMKKSRPNSSNIPIIYIHGQKTMKLCQSKRMSRCSLQTDDSFRTIEPNGFYPCFQSTEDTPIRE
jgi:hypothetical protein